jgi:hypothetical protein
MMVSEIIDRLSGFGFAGVLVAVGLYVFWRLSKRTDTNSQWLELASKTLDGFRTVTDTLTALKESILDETKERQKDSGKVNELLTSLSVAMPNILDILKTMMGEMKNMGDEAEKRRAADTADTKTRYDALREELSSYNIRLSAVEKAVQGIIETQREALETLTQRVVKEVAGLREAVVSDVRGVVASLVKEAVELALKEREKAAPPPDPATKPDTPDAPPAVPTTGGDYPHTPLPPPMKKEDAPR